MRQTKSESNLTSVGKNSIRLHHIHESQRRIRRPTTESDCIEVGEDTPKMTNSPHSDFRSEKVGSITGNAQHKHGCASDCFDVPQEVCSIAGRTQDANYRLSLPIKREMRNGPFSPAPLRERASKICNMCKIFIALFYGLSRRCGAQRSLRAPSNRVCCVTGRVGRGRSEEL